MRVLCLLLMTATLAASDWSPIAKWSGSGTKETETFATPAKEWRIRWTADPIDRTFAGSGVKSFSVQVLKDGSDLPVSTLSAGKDETSGESYVRGAGSYHLKITAVNAKWSLIAEQP